MGLFRLQNVREHLGDIDDGLRGDESGSGPLAPEGGPPSDTLSLHDPQQSERELTINAVDPSPDSEWQDADVFVGHRSEGEWADALSRAKGADGRHIRDRVDLAGIDALGFYLTFHHRSPRWGCYIRTSGLVWLASNVYWRVCGEASKAVRLAYRAIIEHELMHFAVDYALVQLELQTRMAVFWPAFDARQREAKVMATLHEAEERLANGYMLMRMKTLPRALRTAGAYEATKCFAAAQPAGYCDGYQIVGPRALRNGACNELIMEVLCNSPVSAEVVDYYRLFPVDQSVEWQRCPIFLIEDGAQFGIPAGTSWFVTAIAQIHEMPRFCKRLAALDRRIQREWAHTKERLKRSVTGGRGLQKWPDGGAGAFSVRVNRDVRAHLRHVPSEGKWYAEDIGHHKEMGHG